MPNTRMMSQWADGGIVASKPYVSSANYIRKMGDYCKTCFYDFKKKYGDGACPFNSLYWNFFEQHRTILEKNHRVRMMIRTWDRMKKEERINILDQAQSYRSHI